jgi:hypothetical protein
MQLGGKWLGKFREGGNNSVEIFLDAVYVVMNDYATKIIVYVRTHVGTIIIIINCYWDVTRWQ